MVVHRGHRRRVVVVREKEEEEVRASTRLLRYGWRQECASLGDAQPAVTRVPSRLRREEQREKDLVGVRGTRGRIVFPRFNL